MNFIGYFDFLISVIFMVCYSYQFIYILVSLFKKDKPHRNRVLHRYAVLICARNEEDVIGRLIDSVKAQDYPESLVSVFVMADNCTDNTRLLAKKAGAYVYTRHNTRLVGKGWRLDSLIKRIWRDWGEDAFDGYFVFDRDNVLSPGYISRMNRTFSDGFEIITSYRNSKNYGENMISAGYRLWFLREAEYLHHSRALCGVSRGVSGTGFMFSSRLRQENRGWPFHLLTEDIEFTAHSILKGYKIGYCPDAVFFDEQPVTFKASVVQRLRWRKGYYQVFAKHGASLFKGAFIDGNFSCYDMVMNLLPAALLTAAGVLTNLWVFVHSVLTGRDMAVLGVSLLEMSLRAYGMLFFIGAVTTLTQWKHIYAKKWQKILYAFTFPLFMFTWIPISFAALFCDVTWAPIEHKEKKTFSDIMRAG